MVMALFRPKPGKDGDLMACMRDHLPILRAQGLATNRATMILRAKDGTLVEIFEWVSQAAIDAAHTNPAVLALWNRYAECCDYVTLADLPEARAMFPDSSSSRHELATKASEGSTRLDSFRPLR